jgi:hypothetical protein
MENSETGGGGGGETSNSFIIEWEIWRLAMQILFPTVSKILYMGGATPTGNLSNHVAPGKDAANYEGWKSWRNVYSWCIL